MSCKTLGQIAHHGDANQADTQTPEVVLAAGLVSGLLQVDTILKALQRLPQGQAQTHFVELGVGKHLRHIYDHFLAVKKGIDSGCIDYNLRNRGGLLEADITASAQQLTVLLTWCHQLPRYAAVFDQTLRVESEVDCLQQALLPFDSTLARELLYLINHTIHHVAYVKLLLSTRQIVLPASVGLAPSTATFEREAASAP
ncbi:hypothetical protein [Marinagarivorans algicola]|uniref:hypothetical protein n=1 Tax=Marinagarivorans algicola TaxID=1513270 RepID=UPI0006B93FA7|nr:hypothetical protein [Marinagarivorans algicola]